MARFNEINVGRFNRALQKFTGIKGAAPTPQLSTEFMPVFPFFWGIENRYLESWTRYALMVNSPATAAQQNGVRMRNASNTGIPVVGTGVMVVVEKIQIANPGAAAMQAFVNIDNAGAVGAEIPGGGAVSFTSLDARGQQGTVMFGHMTFGNALSVGVGIWAALLPVNGMFDVILDENQELEIPDRGCLQAWTNNVNVPFQCGITWRERVLEESEKI